MAEYIRRASVKIVQQSNKRGFVRIEYFTPINCCFAGPKRLLGFPDGRRILQPFIASFVGLRDIQLYLITLDTMGRARALVLEI